ncbi:hypothetical protein ABIA00_000122 [Bradyrhizobium ottawaense]|uniref:hypothetical protein n=1 Tax=Bradyrhizobium ottawaense TaxID=931866 RepID=UPI00383810A0
MTDSQPHKMRKRNQSDEELISYFKSEAMKGPLKADYVRRLVSELTRFIYWCCSTGRPPIAGRLNQLDDDVKSYNDEMRLDNDYSASILNNALNKLRNPKLLRGGFIEAEVAEDEELIREVRT